MNIDPHVHVCSSYTNILLNAISLFLIYGNAEIDVHESDDI